jgi:hypothetical protein
MSKSPQLTQSAEQGLNLCHAAVPVVYTKQTTTLFLLHWDMSTATNLLNQILESLIKIPPFRHSGCAWLHLCPHLSRKLLVTMTSAYAGHNIITSIVLPMSANKSLSWVVKDWDTHHFQLLDYAHLNFLAA